jgi:hypothetical protein
MSRRFRFLRRGFGVVAAAGVIALATAGGPAFAWDGHGHHGHHHGNDVFFSFGFSSAPYYYDPYPYGPIYAYPPAYYAYPPAYAYQPPYPYDQGPMSYQGGPSSGAGPDNGPYCREFQTTIVIDGQPQSAHGTACQQPDGSWAVVH